MSYLDVCVKSMTLNGVSLTQQNQAIKKKSVQKIYMYVEGNFHKEKFMVNSFISLAGTNSFIWTHSRWEPNNQTCGPTID